MFWNRLGTPKQKGHDLCDVLSATELITKDRVLWDTIDSSVFTASDQNNIYTFIYTQVEVGGTGPLPLDPKLEH
eukprot:4793790-Amphidinium_carterae.1